MNSHSPQFNFRRSDPNAVLEQLRQSSASYATEAPLLEVQGDQNLSATANVSAKPLGRSRLAPEPPVDLKIFSDEMADSISNQPREYVARGEQPSLQNELNAELSRLVADSKRSKLELEERRADFEVRVWDWQQAASRQQAEIDRRESALDFREQQLGLLRNELADLQNALIDQAIKARTKS